MQPAWSSYEAVAETYASVAERIYFAAPARDLAALIHPRDGRVLDIGTGSGVVAAAIHGARSIFGCDPALSMLRLARVRVPGAQFIAGSLPHIPFRSHTFDAVTLGFVLSHVSDVVRALQEVKRVLKRGGEVALSSWSASPGSSPPGAAWQAAAHEFVPAEELEHAVSSSLPSEEQLLSTTGFANSLREAEFEEWRIYQRSYRIDVETDDYVASRLASLSSRYMFCNLPSREWKRFVTTARQRLQQQFGTTLSFETSVNLAHAAA